MTFDIFMRWLFAWLAFGWLGWTLPGCGEPKYAGTPTKADSEVVLGGGRGIRIGADMKGNLEGFETTGADGHVTKVQKLNIEQAPSATIGAWTNPMMAYAQQQLNYAEIRKAEWAGLVAWSDSFWTGLSKETAAIAPIASQWIGAKSAVKMAEIQQGSLIQQLTGLVGGGQVTMPQIRNLDAQVAAMVEAELARRFPPVIAPPTTQPAAATGSSRVALTE